MEVEDEVDEFLLNEVEKACKNIKERKSPGLDEVNLEMIKAADPMGTQWLGRVSKHVRKSM